MSKKVNITSNFLDSFYVVEQGMMGPSHICRLPGKHKHVPDEKFDQKELDMGIEVEKEHTDDPFIAKEIAKDHLAELPDYYTRLKKMEEDGKRELGIKDEEEMEESVNPRGIERPMTGEGKGKGKSGGQRGGKNEKPCPVGGPGQGKGGGRGKGKNRNEAQWGTDYGDESEPEIK